MVGAIGQALQTGQIPQGQPVSQLANDPEYQALVAQFGPAVAAEMMARKRGQVGQFVQNMNAMGQQEDPRAQMARMAAIAPMGGR